MYVSKEEWEMVTLINMGDSCDECPFAGQS